MRLTSIGKGDEGGQRRRPPPQGEAPPSLAPSFLIPASLAAPAVQESPGGGPPASADLATAPARPTGEPLRSFSSSFKCLNGVDVPHTISVLGVEHSEHRSRRVRTRRPIAQEEYGTVPDDDEVRETAPKWSDHDPSDGRRIGRDQSTHDVLRWRPFGLSSEGGRGAGEARAGPRSEGAQSSRCLPPESAQVGQNFRQE
jgi:hypothetical protein